MNDLLLNILVKAQNQTGPSFNAVAAALQKISKTTLQAADSALKFDKSNAALAIAQQKVAVASDQAVIAILKYQQMTADASVSNEQLALAADQAELAMARLDAAEIAAAEAALKMANANVRVAVAEKEASLGANMFRGAMRGMSTEGAILTKVLESVDVALGMIAGLLALQAIQAVLGFGQASVKMAGEFERSMNMVQALTGSTTAQMAYYSKQVLALSAETGKGAVELSKGLYFIISAGYQGAEAMKMLELSTKDAVIGLTDSKTTADALTKVMRGFGISIKDVDAANGEMLRTVTLGEMSMADYAAAISRVLATSVRMRVSMEETNALIATLTANGVKNAKKAATDALHIEEKLMGGTDKIIKNMQALGVHGFDAAKFKMMDFSQRILYLNDVLRGTGIQIDQIIGKDQSAAEAFTVVGNHTKVYTGNLKDLSNMHKNAAATGDAWAITQAGYAQTMARLNASIQVMSIKFGTILLPVLTKVLDKLIPLIDQWNRWMDDTKIQKTTDYWTHVLDIFGKLINVLLDFVNTYERVTHAAMWLTDLLSGHVQSAVDHFLIAFKPFLELYNSIASVLGIPQIAMPTSGGGGLSASVVDKSGSGPRKPNPNALDAPPSSQYAGGPTASGTGKGRGRGSTTEKFTSPDIVAVLKEANKMHIKINAHLFASLSNAQKMRYLLEKVHGNTDKLHQLLSGVHKTLRDYLEYTASQHHARGTGKHRGSGSGSGASKKGTLIVDEPGGGTRAVEGYWDSNGQFHGSEFQSGGASSGTTGAHHRGRRGGSSSAAGGNSAALSGSSSGGGLIINNYVTYNIVVNAAKASAIEVAREVDKLMSKDLRRSGNFVTSTSGGRSR